MATHESYSNSKDKLRTIWNRQDGSESEIAVQQNVNISIESKIKTTNFAVQSLNKLTEINTEWENMDSVSDAVNRKAYRTILNPFPEELIPFIKTEVIHRFGTGETSGGDPLPELPNTAGFRKQCVFGVADLFDDNGNVVNRLKIVTVNDFVWLRNLNGEAPLYQVRLLLTIFNPKEYL